jgi:hypothetical protein
MSSKSVLDKYYQLPPDAKKEANDFVQFLYNQYVKSTSQTKADKPLSEYDFVGMWKDRDDMKDSTAWVREQRKGQWRDR